MSISLSQHALLSSTPTISTSYRHKTLENHPRWSVFLHPLPVPFRRKPLRHCSYSPVNHCNANSCIRVNRARSFLARSTLEANAADADAETEENEEKDIEATKEVDLEDQSSLKNVLKLYKDAILHVNQKTISEVEAKISVIDTKNIELSQKVDALSAEITSGKEKYIRLQADFENVRKRLEKSRLRVRSDAKGEVIESLLPMVDSFEKVRQQIKLETEKEKKIDASYKGIYKQFVEIMKSLQVAAVPTVGKPFDPAVHEAIAREESAAQEGTVIQELRRGFFLGDRLLRPAKVKVSRGPGSKRHSGVGADIVEQPATAIGER